MREVVRFATNVPQEVVLEYDHGRNVEGRYGDQVMFSLEGERCMYVPPIVGDHLAKLGARKGDHLVICKAEVKSGNRCVLQWKVQKVEAASEPSPAAPTTHVSGAVTQQEQPTTASNGARKMVTPGAGSLAGPALANLKLALCAAIDAAQAAEEYAKERSYSLRFGADDIRAMGLTIYIGGQRNGGAA